MKPIANVILEAHVAARANGHVTIEILPGFDDEPWQMELDHRISQPMGAQKAAEYVTERYLIDHPYQLLAVERDGITQAVLQVLNPEQE